MLNPIYSSLTGVFATKLDASGKNLLYSTIIASQNNALAGFDIAVDAAVTGYATQGFPITPGAFDSTPNGRWDVFALKLNPAGNQLLYSTFVGADNDYFLRTAIAVDAEGNAYLTGETGYRFSVPLGAFQTIGDDECFVTKLNATGSRLIYSTYLGGGTVPMPVMTSRWMS